MSDFKPTSLHEELEVRVIALLTGELSESEADELEKILAINEELSAFRDRMAGLMGELHAGSDELAPVAAEPSRRLTEDRRARIFGDAGVLEPESKSPKRPRFKATVWAIAASFAMLFVVGLLSTIQFTKSVLREETVFHAMPVAPAPQAEPEYTVNMRQRNQSTPAPRPPAIVVNNPSELDVPALDIDVNVDESAVHGRDGGGFVGGLTGVREMRDTDVAGQDYARAGETIPVDIPKQLIEGTPQPIRVPGLEPRATQAPRMVVAGRAAQPSEPQAAEAEEQSMSSTREMSLELTGFGYAGEKKDARPGNVDPFAAPPRPAAPASEGKVIQLRSVARSGPVDDFAVPDQSRVSALAKRKSAATESSQEGRSDFLGGDDAATADDQLFANRIDSLSGSKGQVMSREEMLRQVEGSWERSHIVADASPVYNSNLSDKTRDIVIPELNFKGMPLSRALETLSELSMVYDREGSGVNIVPVYDESKRDPKINLSLKNVTLAEAVAKVAGSAGFCYDIAADAITIDQDLDMSAAPLVANQKSKHIVIPQANFSGMPLSQVVETLRGLSVVYDPEQKGIPIEYKPVDGQDPRVNISLRNLSLDRVLQFVTQQVNHEAVDINGEFIRIQPAGQTAVEKAANARAQNVRQTPKSEKLTAEAPFSTFSLNISDVSFKLAQAALQNSRVPPSGQIRTEEFVNSFDYGDPVPRPEEPVSLHWEMAQHPFEHDRQVVRFSLQTQASGRASGQPLNLTLLVDNSGSMQRPDRQAILRNSLETLEQKLTDQDRLNVLLFARQPRLIAEAQTRASQQAAVQSALAYRPEGGTNLEAGLQAAYETARCNYLPAGGNRVILMTDGAANLGNVKAGDLAEFVVGQRKQGIALDAYGIGWDDYNDALLEEITRNGDGRYAFLNSAEDASADFAEKLAGTLRVAAANVKVQIEWNPERVRRYRQIGYDLHQLKKEDFRDNTVDAAEIGEAESGTALYVLQIDEDPRILGGLGTLHVRYLDPASGRYREHSWPLPMPRRVPAAAASPSMRLAMSSALFGERLADSPYAGGYDFRDLYQMTTGLPEAFPTQPRVAELQSMLLQASDLYGEQ